MTRVVIIRDDLSVVTLEPNQVSAVIAWLGATYDEDLVGQAPEDLELGIDLILEGLGRKGHYGT